MKEGIELKEETRQIGIILSGATTSEVVCQLLDSAEKGKIYEGLLVIIETQSKKLLARVSQIIPYNEYYTEGDAWSEARRKGMKIPDEIARQYEICKLDLLMELKTLSEIKYPPRPNDKVKKIDPSKHEKEIFGITQDTPKFVWYGSLIGYPKAPIPIDVEKIPMHIGIFGTTGSGKSFDTGSLIEKLIDIPAGNDIRVAFPLLIIDANGDYLDYANHVIKTKKSIKREGWIKRFVFPKIMREKNSFEKNSKNIFPIKVDLNALSKYELAETIVLYYKGTLDSAALQINGIAQLFDRMESERGFTSLHDLFLDNYDDLLVELYNKDLKISEPTRRAINRQFENFIEIETKYELLSRKEISPLTDQFFVNSITKDGGICIIDFSEVGATGVELKAKQLVMAYLATFLFKKFTEYKIKDDERYLIYLIEEAQNFIPDRSYPIGSSLAKNKLSLIATQGRKFGLSLCLVTQRPSFVDRIILSMCNSFLIHRISPEDIAFVRNVTGGLPSSLANKLTRMGQGELILTGQMNKLPFPLLIKIPDDRIVNHTAGKTNVVERLYEISRG